LSSTTPKSKTPAAEKLRSVSCAASQEAALFLYIKEKKLEKSPFLWYSMKKYVVHTVAGKSFCGGGNKF
jgi:hypothetical protein